MHPRVVLARNLAMKRSLVALAACLTLTSVGAEPSADLLDEARRAERARDPGRALLLYLDAERERPQDAFVLQKIAQQYSDLVVAQPTNEAKKRFAQNALGYAQRAVDLDPQNPVNVLSLAICHGKIAVYSDNRAKVKYSRLVKAEAERALALAPDYAWAHHVLGRWHHEVAALSGSERFFVRLFYGGLPDASGAEAIAHLQRAVELEADELNHHLELGFAYAAAGRMQEARASWTHGLAMPERSVHDAPAKKRAEEALARLARD